MVGTETITSGDYLTYLQAYLRSKLYHGGSPERTRQLAEEALDSLVTDRLLVQEARQRGIEGDTAAIAKRMDGLRERYSGSPDWPQVKQRLPQIEQKLLADSQVATLKDRISEVADPDEAGLQAYYAANQDLFTEPAAWDLDLILLGVPPSAASAEWDRTEAKAAAIVAELKAGRSFAELAAEHSTDNSAARGGKLGRVHKGQLPKSAQTALESLAAGNVSEPLRVLEGYVVFRVNDRIPARLHSFDSVRVRAAKLYRRDRAIAQWDEFVADLRIRTPVETFDVSSHVQKLLAGQ